MNITDHLIEQIYRAIDFFEINTREEINLKDLADKACFSQFHFSRAFHAVTNLSPYEYIIRRRLNESAKDLLLKEDNIIKIAFDYQFSSHEVFSRAFKRVFNQLPSEYKKNNKPEICLSPMSLDYLYCIHNDILTYPEFCNFLSEKITGDYYSAQEIRICCETSPSILVLNSIKNQNHLFWGIKTDHFNEDFLKSYRVIPDFEAINFKINFDLNQLLFLDQYINQIFLLNHPSIYLEPFVIIDDIRFEQETSKPQAQIYMRIKRRVE